MPGIVPANRTALSAMHLAFGWTDRYNRCNMAARLWT